VRIHAVLLLWLFVFAPGSPTWASEFLVDAKFELFVADPDESIPFSSKTIARCLERWR
jgi:hypothetical protein